MPQLQPSAVRNRLLGALKPEDFERLAPHLEAVPVTARQILIASNQPITHANFFEEGLASLIADTSEGRVEIGLVGYEGLVGVPLLLDADRTPHTAMVQADGRVLRIAAAQLRAALEASAALRGVLGRYVQSLLVQVGQTVYATTDYTIEVRLARWLLMADDRFRRNALPLTQELLSMILGVRRPSVTTAVKILENAQAIRSARGRIFVIDRDKLMDFAGDTYGLGESEYERLLRESWH